jgi:hypothetical protein
MGIGECTDAHNSYTSGMCQNSDTRRYVNSGSRRNSGWPTCRTTGPVPPRESVIRSDLGSDLGLENIQLLSSNSFSFGNPSLLAGTRDVYAIQPLATNISSGPHAFFTKSYGLAITKNGKKSSFDARPLLPDSVKTVTGVTTDGLQGLNVYGNVDARTGRQKPTAFGITIDFAFQNAGATGIAAIDQDRRIKQSIIRSNTQSRFRNPANDNIDLATDNLSAELIFVERPGNPFCLLGATLTRPTNTFLISATRGKEYFLHIPDGKEYVIRPQMGLQEVAFRVSARSYLNSLVQSASELPCLSMKEVKKQIASLPPGCSEKQRVRAF